MVVILDGLSAVPNNAGEHSRVVSAILVENWLNESQCFLIAGIDLEAVEHLTSLRILLLQALTSCLSLCSCTAVVLTGIGYATTIGRGTQRTECVGAVLLRMT